MEVPNPMTENDIERICILVVEDRDGDRRRWKELFEDEFADVVTAEFAESFNKTCGGTPESVQVVIRDVAKEDWATAGVLAVDK